MSTSVREEESTVHLKMKRQENSENDDTDNQTSDSKHTLEKERKAYPEESRRAIGDDKYTKHRADVKCTYKCTD